MRPTIAAVVGVRDEHELIAHCVRHLHGQGVGGIVVVDNASRDGTAAILRDLARKGAIELVETAGDPRRDADYFARGIARAKARFAPDWILVQDADEFWLSRSGDLARDMTGARAEAYCIDRFNACLGEPLIAQVAGASLAPGELDVYVAPLRLSSEAMEVDTSLRWIAGQPVGKVIARADRIDDVSTGGHAALARDGAVLPAASRQDLLIVHVPFLTLERFRRKIANADALIADGTFPGQTAWHWKRWVALCEHARLEEEFRRQMLSEDERERLRTHGAIRRASDYLITRRTSPPVATSKRA